MAAGDVTAQLQKASQFNAALFDGVDDYVEVPHNASQLGANLSNGFTISAWINPRSAGEGSAGNIIDKSTATSGANGFCFRLDGTLKIVLAINTQAGTRSTAGLIVVGNWQHVLVLVSSTGSVTYYKNGIFDNGGNQSALSGIITTSVMRIGNISSGTTATFDGSIRSVKMWNRVLTTTEIVQDYAGTNITAGQILHVPLCCDYTEKAKNLTLTNSGTILTNTLSNKVTADMKGLTLAAATDKLIVLPVEGRNDKIMIMKAERAA